MKSIPAILSIATVFILGHGLIADEPNTLNDERQKVAEYSKAKEESEKAKARHAALEAALIALVATDPKSTHLPILEAMLKELEAFAKAQAAATKDLARHHKIVDLTDLPPGG